MIEQTEMLVNEWDYHEPENLREGEKIISETTLEVLRRRARDKKGISCRFTAVFTIGDEKVLTYTGEDSYVIDLQDRIDAHELLNMLRNSFAKFEEKFELRKHATLLHNKVLSPLDETRLDLGTILPLLF